MPRQTGVMTRVQRSPHGHPNAYHHIHPINRVHGQHTTSMTRRRHLGVVSCSISISRVSPHVLYHPPVQKKGDPLACRTKPQPRR